MWKQNDKRKEKAVSLYTDVFKLAFKHTRNQDVSKDIAQTVMEKAIEKIDQLKKEDALKSWVMQITFHEIQAYFRIAQRYQQQFIAETDENCQVVDSIPDDEADILGHLLKVESGQMAISALLKVDEKYQEVLRLHLVCEYSLRETAQLLGLNDSTVRTRFARGLQALRHEFFEMNGEEELR